MESVYDAKMVNNNTNGVVFFPYDIHLNSRSIIHDHIISVVQQTVDSDDVIKDTGVFSEEINNVNLFCISTLSLSAIINCFMGSDAIV